MLLGAFSLEGALGPFAVAAVVLVVTAALLLWNNAAQAARSGPETVIFAHSVGKVIAGAVAMALCATGVGIIGVDPNNGLFLLLVIVGFFALVFWAQFLIPALVFYVADMTGLTRQVLLAKITLPWHAIDWVYPARKTTQYRAYGIKTGSSSEESLMVEAGPKRKIKVTLRAWLVGGDGKPLVNAIQQRATHAQFGFDKSPIVQQRRATGITH